MSSSHRVSPYEPPRQGSRWDRASKDDGDTGNKRKLVSTDGPSRHQGDEPDVKKASLNTQAVNFSMGQNNPPKISMNLAGGESSQSTSDIKKAAPIKLSLGAPKPKETAPALNKPKNFTVAQAFKDDDSSDEEEMPPEAKMRMRNLGKDTPTAAGPNSFGKNRLGFCDRQKVIQREMQKKMDEIGKTD